MDLFRHRLRCGAGYCLGDEMSEKPTLWFPRSVKPSRVGYYEISEDGHVLELRRWWDGSKWLYGGPGGFPSAMNEATSIIKWRGLAKEPK